MTYEFCEELVGIFPGGEFIRRKKGKGFEMGRIAGWAAERGYSHLLVVNEDVKKTSRSSHSSNSGYFLKDCFVLFIDAITICHLPNGPTAYFKLTSVELPKRIKVRKIIIYLIHRLHLFYIVCRDMRALQSTSLNSF